MPVRQLQLPLLVATVTLLLGGCATLPPPESILNYVAPAGTVAPARRAAANARAYDQAANWVARRYYDTALHGVDWPATRARHRTAALVATSDKDLYAAINALLAELHDEHTRALTPREVEEFHRRRGVLLGFRTGPAGSTEGRRRILAVFPGSPAELAGVRPGWILVAADDRPPGEVLGLGKLAEGQLVRCDFLAAPGQPRQIELRARKLEYPPIRDASRRGDGTLLLAFDTFDLPTARWLRAELKRHRPAAGVVLDLRGNGGGEARALAAILAEIFPAQVDLGRIRARNDGSTAPRRSPRHPRAAHYAGPLAVLVSDGSASAAEILASIVQHQHRGAIVGTATAGNVLVCVRWPLSGGGELQLSVYDYYGPDGRRLEGRGVTPDVIVPAAPGVEPDPQIEAAVRALRAGPGAPP